MQLTVTQSPIAAELAGVEERIKSSLSLIGEHFAELAGHLMDIKGKRIRPTLLLLSAKATGGVKPQHLDLAVIVELLHNATLVHDDVLDDAEIRRNAPTFNARWGNETAVLFGDYLCASAFKLCAKVGDMRAIRILSDAAHELCLGELIQTWNKNKYDITESLYLNIIEKKTAALFAASCKLGTLFNDTDENTAHNFAAFGTNFGMAFQIMDDYIDIIGKEEKAGKSLGTDLNKGKITLPVIRLLEVLPANKKKSVLEMLSSDGKVNRRKLLSEIIFLNGVSQYTLSRAALFAQKAKSFLSDVEDSQTRDYIFHLVDNIVP